MNEDASELWFQVGTLSVCGSKQLTTFQGCSDLSMSFQRFPLQNHQNCQRTRVSRNSSNSSTLPPRLRHRAPVAPSRSASTRVWLRQVAAPCCPSARAQRPEAAAPPAAPQSIRRRLQKRLQREVGPTATRLCCRQRPRPIRKWTRQHRWSQPAPPRRPLRVSVSERIVERDWFLPRKSDGDQLVPNCVVSDVLYYPPLIFFSVCVRVQKL